MPTASVGGQVGPAVARWRESVGVRLEELEQALRYVGVPWPASTLSRFERGERDLRLGEAIALLPALELASGRRVSWAGLLGADTEVRATSRIKVSPADLPRPRGQRWKSYPGWKSFAEALVTGTVSELPDATDRRVARSLRVRPELVQTAAMKRYGRTLAAEREARLVVRAKADPHLAERGLRSAISRALVAELRADLEEGN
jgi:transcriptional regulator with XRE-family HTH domain